MLLVLQEVKNSYRFPLRPLDVLLLMYCLRCISKLQFKYTQLWYFLERSCISVFEFARKIPSDYGKHVAKSQRHKVGVLLVDGNECETLEIINLVVTLSYKALNFPSS